MSLLGESVDTVTRFGLF